MLPSLDEYISFLRDCNIAGGFPLVAAGLALMLFGWRMWKICVVLSFAAIGFGAVAYLTGRGPNQLWYAAFGGLLLGAASYQPAKYAINLLGGIIVALIAYLYLLNFHLESYTMLGLTAVALIGGTAFATINRRRIVILVTAFMGAVLLMSGVASWALAFPSFFNSVRYLAERSMIVIPFVLLVPMAMSCFYQIAEVRRVQADL